MKPANEVMYDIINDLFRFIHGSISVNKLEQLKRVADTFTKGIKRIADDSTIEIFERLQKRVYSSFVAMEKDIATLDKKVDDTMKQVEERVAQYEVQVAAAKKAAEELRKDLKKLDDMFKGVGQ